MKVNEFIEGFKEKKIINTKLNEHAVSDYLKEKLEIKTYIPFRMKRTLVETVVIQNIKWVDGVKKIDPINEYIGFIVAVLSAHTNLEWGEDPVADYDLLAENGLLPLIIAEFQESYSECDVLLKMARASELEDNNINISVTRFLNGILEKLDGVGEVLKNTLGDTDIKEILGADFNDESLAKLSGFLNKYNK
jgi:hypothetical protein